MQLPIQGLDESSVSVPSWIALPFHLPNDPAQNGELFFEIPPASNWSLSRSKRFLDVTIAIVALAFLLFPMLVIAICVRLSSKGPALFIQDRVGRGGRLFGIYKFRSMTVNSSHGSAHTRSGDRRITAFGYWLRRFKLDELPQFYNILRGEMSLVGPRPKLPNHDAIANKLYRPGITGAATLAFRREEEILSGIHASQLDGFYARQIKPLKAHIDLEYMSQATFWSDMRLIGRTFLACLAPAGGQVPFRAEETRHENHSMTA
jgi:lipopolysaccharide/colanic/teichoic acid biosynthesis glycosyltransferase